MGKIKQKRTNLIGQSVLVVADKVGCIHFHPVWIDIVAIVQYSYSNG